jgi:hypothetical protein
MSLVATIEKETAVEKETKQNRTRRASLRGMARKVSQAARQLEETAIRAEEQAIADHKRVGELANLATGGSFSAILKKSPALGDDDRAFLKELGYI